MTETPPVTAAIINYRTPDLVERAVHAFRRHYATLPLLLIDNGSHDESAHMLENLRDEAPGHTSLLLNDRNLHHGPAMDQALRRLTSTCILFIDSDVEIRTGGVVERMLDVLLAKPEHYAAGMKIFMNKRGFDVPEGTPEALSYIRPICMVIRRDLYLTLPRFRRHGTPCLENFKAAAGRGLMLAHIPVDDYIHHEGRGTAGRHGYRLGWRGRVNHLLNRLGL